ncbi:MAG: hypothetical protein U1F43_32455 [Myxococcota bacterium]
MTVVYGHQTIYEGGRQEGDVTVGEGRIMTYSAVLDGQPTTRDFSDLLRPIPGWGWELVDPERRHYGTATACPETYGDRELKIYKFYRHPSGVTLDVFTLCLYGDDGRFVHRSHYIEIGPEALRPPPLDWYQAPIDQRPPWPARR